MLEIQERKGIVVIDGANAAAGGGFRPPTLARVLEVKAAAVAKWPTAEIIVVVDATLRHALSPSEREELAVLCRSGEVISTPSCTVGKGDALILAIAGAHDAKIVTNDGLREYLDTSPFLVDPDRVFGIICVDGLATLLLPRQLSACVAR